MIIYLRRCDRTTDMHLRIVHTSIVPYDYQ